MCNEHVPGIMPTKVISPKGEVLAETETDFTYAVADIDLQEKKYIYWLSVGACDGEPHDVYSHERRTDFYGVLAEEMN